MSMVCVSGGRECGGCMACQDKKVIGKCSICNCEIDEEDVANGTVYEIDGELLCGDFGCTEKYMKQFRKVGA